jgi:AraC-like DNA-binding protein
MSRLAFRYTEYKPCPLLRPFIHCYGLFASVPPGGDNGRPAAPEQDRQGFAAGDPLADHLIPSGYVMLFFNLGDPLGVEDHAGKEILPGRSHVLGALTRPGKFIFGQRVELLGAMFRTGRAAAFLDVPARELTDRFTVLSDLWGAEGRALEDDLRELPTTARRIQRLELALVERLARVRPPDLRFVSLADFVMRRQGAVSVEGLSAASGLSRQHLARNFRHLVGVSPKLFCRLTRFNAMLEHVVRQASLNWAALAAEHGYYDQAHLIAEFREFTGLRPTEFVAWRQPARRDSQGASVAAD